MRIVFIGAVKFSHAALLHLFKLQADIVGVCGLTSSTFHADHVDLTPVCKKFCVPARNTPDINSTENVTWIKALSPDVIFCFGWSQLIKEPLRTAAPLGVIGFHPAALPKNRGRHPLIWALVLGLSKTASTFFIMNERVDSGDIISQVCVPILDTDNAMALYDRVTNTALKQISQFIIDLEKGALKRTPQVDDEATYWRKRTAADGHIDWRMSTTSIHNLVRGLSAPYVGAHFIFHGHDIKVWKTERRDSTDKSLEPGKVQNVEADGIVIKTGDGAIKLCCYEPAIKILPGQHLT